jgi:putative redox protein
MSSKKITFKNQKGNELAARLDLPDNTHPHSYAIFAHCFTCNKDLKAVANVARALNNSGFGVLRFDFTGLGQSEGEFGDTTFSSNVQDLHDAASWLAENHKPPELLIGHSLGGAAVIFAAAEMDSARAVAVIGAPSSPEHVVQHFSEGLDQIEQVGMAEVNIGGRPFNVSKQFIDDLRSKEMKQVLPKLNKSLLVLHSPQDRIVSIKNAEEIYLAARHPKSYISLDGADHLLADKRDSAYAGKVIAGWAERYLEIPERETPETHHQVAVSLGNKGYTAEVAAGKHLLLADEPEEAGGNDFGPSPYEFVSAGLGACTAMTLRMYADRKKWDLHKVVVHLDHEKDYPEDMPDRENKKKISHISRAIELHGDLDDDQRQRLLEIANKCPVHKTLSETPVINTMLIKELKNDKQ